MAEHAAALDLAACAEPDGSWRAAGQLLTLPPPRQTVALFSASCVCADDLTPAE